MITIVCPWYGPDTQGGAETHTRGLACALHNIGVPVQVWASTGRDAFHTTATQHYPAGMSELDDIPIWRFRLSPSDERGIPTFFRYLPERLPPLENFPTHELQLLHSLVSSDELYAAVLDRHIDRHFIFLPYPFPTTFWGALLAGDRSFLLPCLHDEPYARYNTYRFLFSHVQGILANSYAEAQLVRRLYSLPNERICVVGGGLNPAPQGDGAAFRRRYGLENCRILLTIGRRDDSKNIPLLLAYTREYWARRGGSLRLLTAGPGELHLPSALHDVILDLGYLDTQSKYDAYAAADVFIQPSLHESFSIVLMEAWQQGIPALVHANCAVTCDYAQRSGGGLCFSDFGTFAAALDMLLAAADVRHTLGERGRRFVQETCCWGAVARRIAAFVLNER